MLGWCIVTLAGAKLKASVWFPLLRGMYQRGTCKGCNIQGTKDLMKKMICMKNDIVKEAKEYAEYSSTSIKNHWYTTLIAQKQLAATMQCIDSAAERAEAFAINGNMDLSN